VAGVGLGPDVRSFLPDRLLKSESHILHEIDFFPCGKISRVAGRVLSVAADIGQAIEEG
jgi:hypothetical protein